MKRSTLAAKLLGFVTLSMLSTGCSILPFGGGRSRANMARAMRPEIHEVKPNTQSECLAEDATTATTTPATPATDGHACTACACAATASAKTRGGAAKQIAATTARPVEVSGPADRELQRLMDGNKRFVEGEADNDVWSRALQTGDLSPVAGRAAPAAIVVACGGGAADVAAQGLFDARPGELLLISAPAEITDDAVVATARDAVQQYEIPLIVVLGRRAPAPASADGDARQAAHKVGRESSDLDGGGSPALNSADRLVASDASLGARVAARRLKVVAANCDETNGQVSLEVAGDASDAAPKTPPAEQVVQLPQD
jgi:hypothetical protein